MDQLDVVEVNAATFRYQDELISVYRSIADPFSNQLLEVGYEPNPTDMTQLTKQITFASGQPDGAALAM